MAFPSEKELKLIRKKLAAVDPSRMLSKNASEVDKLKYKLCEKFVIYLLENDLTQVELAKKLKVDPARVNEIVKYKLSLFTIDTLISHAESLKMNIKVQVA